MFPLIFLGYDSEHTKKNNSAKTVNYLKKQFEITNYPNDLETEKIALETKLTTVQVKGISNLTI